MQVLIQLPYHVGDVLRSCGRQGDLRRKHANSGSKNFAN
jgi:hypothetical protein